MGRHRVVGGGSGLNPKLPFILITGKGSEEVASEAITAGVTDHLQKGSGTEQPKLLANRITNAVAQSRGERRATEQERTLWLLRDINQALVGATTPPEIERAVTDHLTVAEPYLAVLTIRATLQPLFVK